MHADQCVAVLSIRRPVEKPFELSQLQKISSVVSAYAPALKLLEHANRSVLRHAMESFAKNVARVFPRGSIRRPLMLGLTVVAVGCFLLRDTDYIVSVPCEIAPARELQLAAPFQGVIAESCVLPGERVQAGQLLLRMETELLEIEYEAAQTQRQIAQLELAQHAAAGNLAETALADSRIQVAENTIATIRHQLEQAEVKAPSDGYVIAGQLDRRVGEVVPMGEPLLQFAAADEWVVELHVPEFSASYLNVQMKGEFAINARPEEACSFNLEQMEVTAGNVNGQNVFVAKGRIEGTVSPWLRSGMQGTAKVNAGQKPTWWVWFHRSLDALRLQVWKW
jgi:biotin carboxyl carrier protein